MRRLVRCAIEEDFGRTVDWTSHWLVEPDARGALTIRSRSPGLVCGLRAIDVLLDEFHTRVAATCHVEDGAAVEREQPVLRLSGALRDLLAVERTLLNLLSHLSGVATLTARFVRAVREFPAVICDTRKTLPGWRRLAKYAVRCGGGVNHRSGLFDAVLIKDNHLAAWAAAHGKSDDDPSIVAEAIASARDWLKSTPPTWFGHQAPVIEVEVDRLDQFDMALAARPDLILLDNFPLADLRSAVQERDRRAPDVGLEASGGIGLDDVTAVAATGVDRISIGAITHSAPALDLGADWEKEEASSTRT